jgi:hypothetical protein
VGTDGSQAGPYQLLENTQVQKLSEDLETAKRLGVHPMHVDDPGFEEVANAGLIKWAVTEHGELLVIAHSVGTEEIAQTVLTNGRPVRAAGVAEIVVDDYGPVGIRISTEKNGLEIGKQAFQAFGIAFLLEKDTSGDVDGKGSNSSHERHDENHGERQNRGDRDGNNGGNGGGHPVAYDGSSSESDEEQEKREG